MIGPPTAAGWLRTVVDGLLAVVLAPSCAACRCPLDRPLEGVVCRRCWDAVRQFPLPLCRHCGEPLAAWRMVDAETATCPRCRRSRSAIGIAGAIGPYDGPLRAIVQALKYDGRRSLAAPLASRMREAVPEVLAGVDLTVPVPLHPRRQRARGFNQAEDLARGLGLPVARALRRTRPTVSQTDLPAARRHANVRGAFAVVEGSGIRGRCVLLVDDVSTTGATTEACARVLLAAGAREVRALTAARVVTTPR
jgi:ComF family protein